jgi:hypothetical protein
MLTVPSNYLLTFLYIKPTTRSGSKGGTEWSELGEVLHLRATTPRCAPETSRASSGKGENFID